MLRKVENKYVWTSHVQSKMRHYGISESLVKRVIRHPDRVEEAIVPDLVAAMKKTKSKQYPEVWVMYTPDTQGKITIITAWRYPGETKKGDALPEAIQKEVRSIIGF